MIASGNGSSRQAMAARTMRNALMGVVTTALTAAALGLGWLAPLERVAHDQRTRWFAHHTPRPSPAIVHIDIDDASLARTGRWPWPRTYLANVTAELTRAGAKVIAFDLLLDEPQPPRVVLADDQDPADRSPEVIQDDRALARAIAAHGNVVLAVRTGPTDQADPISRRVVEALTADLDLPAINFASGSISTPKRRGGSIGRSRRCAPGPRVARSSRCGASWAACRRSMSVGRRCCPACRTRCVNRRR